MGFFSDLKEDLSQAVNELLPDENLEELVEDQEIAGEEGNEGEALEQESENVAEDAIDLEKMHLNTIVHRLRYNICQYNWNHIL